MLLMVTACSSVGCWPGQRYAVYLRLRSNVVSRCNDFEYDVRVLNLTGSPLEFHFCDGRQYVMSFHDALNRSVFRWPAEVITMETSFTVPPFGLHTIDACVPSEELERLPPGGYRVRAHIEYDELPCAQTPLFLMP
jgi:hypothetical protein